MSYTVVVSDNKTVDLETERAILAEVGAELVPASTATVEEVVEAAAGADAMLVDSITPLPAEVFERVSSLRVVGRAGIGVDNVDVAAANEHGVEVVHVPDYCIDEVAIHALGLLLSCVRKIPHFDRRIHGGEWDWSTGQPIHRVAGGTLGLVSFGKIARHLAELVSGFDLTVLAYDPYVEAETMAEYGVEKADFGELLSRSDYVSVHAPLYGETRNLLDAAAFETMREDAVLVNTARGPVVDDDALAAALDAGDLAGAGLDVLPEEPPEDSPLTGRDDVVLTPHVGWYSEESRRDLSESVARDVARVLDGAVPENPVDPEIPWI